MMAPDVPTFDFKQAVAVQFGDRPTLRQVASEQLLKLLLVELPWLAFVTPALTNADPLMLDSPDPATAYWTTQPLVDRVLQALLEPRPLDIEPFKGRHHNLALQATHRFAGSSSEFDTRQLSGLSSSLNELIQQLPQRFCEAQLDYWNALGSVGVSRDRWLQILLKTALLRGLPFQALDSKAQACIRGLIRGGADQPAVWFVQTTWTSASVTYEETSCHLLVAGEWDEQQLILWCAPSGRVRNFDSLSEFADALRDDLAQRYNFEQMSWQRYPAEGNVFSQQVSLLLEAQFQRVDRAAYRNIADMAELEQRFAHLSDPSSWFISYADDTAAVPPPPGWRRSSAANSFACHAALLQLALDQLDSDGIAALDGVQALNDYARDQLSGQMRSSHKDDSSPDDLLLDLYLARGEPGGAAVGAGGGEPLVFVGSKSLTEFAIGNLASLKGATIKKVRRRDGKDAPLWLDAEAASKLVAQVDIGGRYPAYVAGRLDDSDQRPERIRRFAREWRSALLQSAITAKLDGKVTESGLQCVVDYCAGHVDPDTPRMMLIPLAFRRSRHSRQSDPVHCMYLLFSAEPSLVLLYRPLFKQDTLRQYADLSALLDHVRESSLLQASLLQWMDPAVRSIYANDGFSEPHVAVIGIDPYTLPQRPEAAVLDIKFWRNNVDERLYQANRDTLLILADQQSVSNAENRWQTLCEGAWLLFDVATLLVRGPVASASWLVQLLSTLQSDLQALEQGDEFQRSAAIADLLLNMGMTLLHGRQPKLDATPSTQPPDASAFDYPLAQSGAFAGLSVTPEQRAVNAGEALSPYAGQWIDFSWRGQQGFNWLPPMQRRALQAMRSGVSLNGLRPFSDGEAIGLYQVGNDYYVSLIGDVYRVELSNRQVRIVDEEGSHGPRLVLEHGVWRVDTGLVLVGGMRGQGSGRRMATSFGTLQKSLGELNKSIMTETGHFFAVVKDVNDLQDKVTRLEAIKSAGQAKLQQLPEGADAAATRTAIHQYDVRLAQWENEISLLRMKAVEKLEPVVVSEAACLSLVELIQEQKYATERAAVSWESGHSDLQTTWINSLIANSDFIFHELWELANYKALAELQQSLSAKPLSEMVDVYLALRTKLEQITGFQERMLVAHEQLDERLIKADDNLQIQMLSGKTTTVKQIIAARTFSTIQLRFNQVINLADLALHLETTTGRAIVAGYREGIMGWSLRNAAGAHGELDFVNLSAEDRIVILQEAWDEYSAALFESAGILRKGGELIEPAMLERYREHMEKLKLDAGRRLVQAIQDQDKPPAAPRRTAYIVSTAMHRVVRSSAGQLLIGTEVEENGQQVVEVREPFSDKVLMMFDLVGGQWQERQETSSASPQIAPATDLAMRVQALLDESVEVEQRANDRVLHDIKGSLVAQMFDRQLDKLYAAVEDLREQGMADRLTRELERTSDRLRSSKILQLTNLYSETKYPTAEALQFLHEQRLIKVYYVGRKNMHDGSPFDEYKIVRLAKPESSGGRNLWVAHFHFERADDYPTNFTRGHLKTWRQRSMSNRPELSTGERVHRGKLTLEQATGIIPFN